jgi:hypothetical protein
MSIDISAIRYRNFDRQYFMESFRFFANTVTDRFIRKKYKINSDAYGFRDVDEHPEFNKIKQKLLDADIKTIDHLKEYDMQCPTFEEFLAMSKEDEACFKSILESHGVDYPELDAPAPILPRGCSGDNFCSNAGTRLIFEEFNKIKQYSHDKTLRLNSVKFVFSDELNRLMARFPGPAGAFTAKEWETMITVDNMYILPFFFPGIIHIKPGMFKNGRSSSNSFYIDKDHADWREYHSFRPIATKNCDWISVYTIREILHTLLTYYEIKTPFMEIYNSSDGWLGISEDTFGKIEDCRKRHPNPKCSWSSLITLMKFSEVAIRYDNILELS